MQDLKKRKKFVAEWRGTRQPSARYVALGKETFVDGFFAECFLPSAALGKAFAECNRGFAECPKHSAKSPSAVVKGRPSVVFVTIARR
jgi:hypothetical protein